MKRSLAFFCSLMLLSTPVVASGSRYDIPIGDSPSLGPENAPVTLIEFIDFQ